MCGICGIASLENLHPDAAGFVLDMTNSLVHRGPDDDGLFVNANAALGIRRLSIIDLTTGQQPISNEDGSLSLVFNGEIYNYRSIRQKLIAKGHVFKSKSDSEVIIHAYEEYGLEFLTLLNGIFAFAIWDNRNFRLILARDRMGVKPLYYWHGSQSIIFASELKAILQHPDVPLEVDPVALDHFLTLEYIPSPRSIFAGIQKLPPSHFLVFESGNCQVNRYWDVSRNNNFIEDKDYNERLLELLDDAVKMQMVSDVPIGAFLSGGIDSSTILHFMNAHSEDSISTFSIGFEDLTYNELADARLVADFFATSHRDEVLRPEIAGLAEKLIAHLDEPLADFSIFPTYLVSYLASKHVKVVLSGDGGDELFGGYDSYVAEQLDRLYRRLPVHFRQRTLPNLMAQISPRPQKKGLINKSKRFVEGAAMSPALQHTRWMIFLGAEEKRHLYRPTFQESINGCQSTEMLIAKFERASQWDSLAQQQYVDINTYLADNILAKVDRMSMAASIEARVPLLDHRLVEFALNLPPYKKLRRGQTKVILREVMKNRLPTEVLKKPKKGFSIPLKNWLRGPLREMMTDLLASNTFRSRGFFEMDSVNRLMSSHLNGREDNSHRLWALMVFEAWLLQLKKQ